MKLIPFLKDRFMLLIMHVICMGALSAFLSLTGYGSTGILLILIFWAVILACWLLVTYYGRKRYFDEIEKVLENIDQRYLLGELLPYSYRLEDRLYGEMLHFSNKAVIERIRELEDAQRDYREYIESWVHEIKTPVSVIDLLCENAKTPAKDSITALPSIKETLRSIRLERKHFAITLYESITIVTYGMSNSFNQVAITLVQIVLNNSLVYYGALSPYGREMPLAASGIVMKTNAILLAIIIGISQGTQPIIGFNYGAGNFDRVKKAFRLLLGSCVVCTVVMWLLVELWPDVFISIFNNKPELAFFGKGNELYYQFAVHFMRVFLLMVLVNGVQLLSSNFFAAIGKPLKGMFLSMTRQVLFLMPLLVALPLVFGLEGILYAGPAADLAAFLVTLGFIVREMQNIRRKEEALSAPTS